MNIFEFLVIAVVVQGISRIVVRWLRTRDGVSQRHIKELEQRIHILEAQHVKDLQKRLGVLEEIFVTEDITHGSLIFIGVLRIHNVLYFALLANSSTFL